MISLSLTQLWLYAFAIFILFLTPGPVWVAIMARAMATGPQGAWPLAAGVAVGDLIWPLVAIGGVGMLAQFHSAIKPILVLIAVIIFLIMGMTLIWRADTQPDQLSQLTPNGFMAGFTAGFIAGFLVIISNPKAILFYMGILPGFFNLAEITASDAILISLISASVPFLGNVSLAILIGKSRQWLATPSRLRRLNQFSSVLLIAVGVIILLTKI